MTFINKNLIYVSAYFIVVFCCFFLTAVLPLSPIYVTFFLAICFILFVGRWKKIPDESIFIYLPFLLLFLYMIIDGILLSSMKSFLIMAYFFLFYIFGDFILYQIDVKYLKKIIKSYLYFNLLLMIADLIYRIIMARNFTGQTFISPIYMFYLFKYTSLLHLDANGSGVVILSILSVLVFLNSACGKIKLYRKMYIAFFILLVLTFARASIMAHILLLLFIHLFVKRTIFFKIVVIVIGFFSFMTIFNFLTTRGNIMDGSYNSKLEIFTSTFEYLKEANIFQILFGNGEQSSISVMGIPAHNFISSLLIDSGLISLLLYILIFIVTAMDVKSGWYIVLIPFFITSLSYTPLTTPYVFISALLIKHIKLKGLSNI